MRRFPFNDMRVVAGVLSPRNRGLLARLLEKSSFSTGITLAEEYTAGEPELEDAFKLVERLWKLGLIEKMRAIESSPDEPQLFGFTAQKAGGASFFSKQSALWAAAAEALECGIWRKGVDHFKDAQTLTIKAAWAKGGLHPSRLAGFTKKQREEQPFHFSDATEILWTSGHSIVNGRTMLVPAQVHSSKWGREAILEKKEPLLRSPITTGLATGTSFDEASVKGLLEVIERDAFMVSYLNKLSLPRLDLEQFSEQSEKVSFICSSFKRYLLEAHAILLLSDFSLPVVCGVIIDRTGAGPAVSVGAKASFSLEDAVVGALTEAASVYRSNRRLRMSPLFTSKKTVGREERLSLWSQKSQLPLIEFFIQGKIVPPSSTETGPLARAHPSAQLSHIASSCRTKGYEAIVIDLSSSSLNPSTLSVVFAIIPELQPLHLDEQTPYFGGERLRTVPQAFGYTPAEIPNTEPHPFP